jgi:hypothetical protein
VEEEQPLTAPSANTAVSANEKVRVERFMVGLLSKFKYSGKHAA